jgi:parvulin-like peptidyl-prolyl isomerase
MALSLHRRAFWPLLAALTLAVAGCHPRISDPHDPNFIVAEEPGDWTITRAQLDHELDSLLKERNTSPAQIGAANMPVVETEVLRRMALEKVLLAHATKRNFPDADKMAQDALVRIKGRFPTEQDFQDKLKQTGMTEDDLKKSIHDQVLIEELFKADALHDTEPSDKEVNDFYLGHKDLFQVPLKLRASRVLVVVDEKATPAQKADKKKIIDAAHARVAKGEDFSKVATDVSDDRYSAPRGGDIGYFQRGENEPQFDDVAFASKVGELSPVFETPMGYQFLKVTEIKPAGLLTIDEARQPIAENLQKMKIDQEKEAYAEKLMKESNVKYDIPLTDPPANPGPPAGDTSAPPDSNATPAAPGGP